MKKMIILFGGILIVLLFVFFTLVFKNTNTIPQQAIPTPPTTAITDVPIASTTLYPEYQLPTPERIAPDGDPNAYEKLPRDQQEFSSLVVSLPIKTSEYSIDFNFSNSTFNVVIFTDQGLKDYETLRQKYPNIKESLFYIQDTRQTQ